MEEERRISSFLFLSNSPYHMLGFLVKNPPAMWETWVRFLGWEDLLEKGKATPSSILAWRIPWTCIVQEVTKGEYFYYCLSESLSQFLSFAHLHMNTHSLRYKGMGFSFCKVLGRLQTDVVCPLPNTFAGSLI